MTPRDPLPLSPLEARVLGVLVEKQATVPDTYPLSINALTSGCNQRNNRDPVMSATEAEVQSCIERLKSVSMVVESSGARVLRYSHNFGRALQVPSAAVALLATLMLRGPQTVAELRANSERLHRFADGSAVEGYLDELAARSPPLALELPRQPGTRETRWTHLLCGPPDESLLQPTRESPVRAISPGAGVPGEASTERLAALEDRVHRLEQELGELRRTLAGLQDTSGSPPPRH